MYDLKEIAEKIKGDAHFTGRILLDEIVSPRTTFKIGGIAPLLLEPDTEESLVFAVTLFTQTDIPFFILGGGSNVVVSDSGFEGAVISTCRLLSMSCNKTVSAKQGDKITVTCAAGVPMNRFVRFCAKNALSGSESFAGLPGSVGGAVFMNAQCFGLSISDIVESVCYIEEKTIAEKTRPFKRDEWGYKISPFTKRADIITSAAFKLTNCLECEKKAIEDRCSSIVAERIAKGHFKYPSAGSVFKNNRAFGFPSGKLIDDAGLKGYRYGGARIAPWHGNIIINEGGATQTDVRSIVSHVIDTVQKRTGFTLECEIIFCGK